MGDKQEQTPHVSSSEAEMEMDVEYDNSKDIINELLDFKGA